jgi:hypothetical protein
MGRLAPRLAVAVAAVCFLTVPARADFVRWDYTTTPANTSVASNGGSGSTANFIGDTNVLAVGNSNIVLAALTTTSSASPTSPATFTSKFWAVDLTITDFSSGATYDFLFGGRLTGSVSSSSSYFTNTFIGQSSITAQIGANNYTVSLVSFTPPGPPSASNRGAISAYVSIAPASGTGTIQSTGSPEPSTMVLAGVGIVGFVASRYRRRKVVAEAGA